MKACYLIPPLVLAALLTSCGYNSAGLIPGAGYSPRDAYHRGHSDGSLDRRRGLSHDPHINESPTLPSAWRNDYIWGYVEGYKNPHAFSTSYK